MIGFATLSTIAVKLGPFEAPSEAYGGVTEPTTILESLISKSIGLVTLIAAVYFIFTVILAGLSWLSAAGDTGKVEKARTQITQGIVGLLIVVAGYGLVGLIGSIFGLQILRPGDTIKSLSPGYEEVGNKGENTGSSGSSLTPSFPRPPTRGPQLEPE